MIAFVPRTHPNINDCWADTLSYATGKTYKEVYKIFKPLVEVDGGLSVSYMDGFLKQHNYRKITLEDYTVNDIITYFNHYDCEIVILVYNHVFYVHNNTIYEYVEPINQVDYLNVIVEHIYIRTKSKE